MADQKDVPSSTDFDTSTQNTKQSTGELNRKDRLMRVSTAQFQMKPIRIWDDLCEHAQFFIDAAVQNKSHFLLFPETFTVELFSTMPFGWSDNQMIRALCDMTDAYLEAFSDLSKQSNLIIIAGSQPILKSDGFIYNVAHMFTPAGNVYTQEKIHITPKEVRLWDMKPGNKINLFDTIYGRIGIQICYDIEFPEVSRLMSLAGVEVIFVPYSTEDFRGYQRVRYCAQTRAIENYIYTVISGNCGTIPVSSYELNFAQSAVFSPSDLAFPTESTMIELDPDIENVVNAELDLLHLAKRRKIASVQPIKDRREDLYQLQSKNPIEIIKVE